jgi:hypothetical protein
MIRYARLPQLHAKPFPVLKEDDAGGFERKFNVCEGSQQILKALLSVSG